MLLRPTNSVASSTIMITAIKEAPAEIPINPGSAKGFLKIPCTAVPEMPKAAPTSSPSITRGIRTMFSTPSCCVDTGNSLNNPIFLPKITTTSFKGICTAPSPMESPALISNATISNMYRPVFLFTTYQLAFNCVIA